MVNLFAAMFFVSLAYGASLLAMIFGWGLTPVSWGWIIFGYVATTVLIAVPKFLEGSDNE